MEAKNSVVQCRICRRTFASQKAVHGHMRSHSQSERQAARSDPGLGSAVAAPLMEDGRSPAERTDLLQGFSRTGKKWSFKRRNPVLAGPGEPEVGERSTPQPPSMEERQSTDLPPRFARTGKRWSFKRRAGPVAPVVWETSSSQPPSMEESEDLDSVDSDGTIQAQNDHVCNICMRSFSSHLALGGHKAHHSMREKKRLAAMGDEKDDEYTSAGEQASVVNEPIPPPQPRHPPPTLVLVNEPIPPPQPRRPPPSPQPCLRCGRIFSSRQALGPHLRFCKGPLPPPPVENQNKVVRDFDLNELPQPEEEGEV